MQNNFKLKYLLYLLFAITDICWNLTPLCRFQKWTFLPRPDGMMPINWNKSLVSADNRGPVYHAFLIVFQEKHILHVFDLDAQTAVKHIFLPALLLLWLVGYWHFWLWKRFSPRSLSASLWVFVKWAVCAISAVLLDSLKLLWPAVCMSLFNDCPSVHCSAQLLSFTQLGHLSDQVADMFSFLFLFISPLFFAHFSILLQGHLFIFFFFPLRKT